MNRFDEIAKVLEYYKLRTLKTNIKEIKRKEVYNFLVRYGLTNDDYMQGIAYKYDAEFALWKRRYKNDPFLRVYETDLQKEFLQFNSTTRGEDHIKIYVSLGRNEIEEGVNRIFDYISKNKMDTVSKVAKYDRSDVIVLRMANEEDATKLINYINSDTFFKKYARKTNPFLMRQGVVGLAYDKYLSYNSVVALVLANYLNEKIKSNNLDKISLNDLRSYLLRLYKDTFMTQTNLENFTKIPEVKGNLDKLPHSEADILLNYMHVLNAMYINLTSNEYKDYIKAYRTSKNEKINKKYKAKMDETLNSPYKNINPKALLDSYIEYALQKYGSREMVEEYLSNYLYGNDSAITRDMGYRKYFLNSMDRDTFATIIGENIGTYIATVEMNLNNQKRKVSSR